ncbi:MAG TPA: DUF2795 domain-containing protein [Rugosimonospora sp.]|nr:DUF2795 domain-containing protein [Rugosimonospora sp.]
MDRANSEHAPRVDDEMSQETLGVTQGQSGAGGRGEDWHDPEPAGEDQPDRTLVPDGGAGHEGGAPSGMTADQREARSRLGRYLPRSAFPAGPQKLVAAAQGEQAPDDIVAALRGLPDGEYQTVAHVYATLVGSTEEELEQRF